MFKKMKKNLQKKMMSVILERIPSVISDMIEESMKKIKELKKATKMVRSNSRIFEGTNVADGNIHSADLMLAEEIGRYLGMVQVVADFFVKPEVKLQLANIIRLGLMEFGPQRSLSSEDLDRIREVSDFDKWNELISGNNANVMALITGFKSGYEKAFLHVIDVFKGDRNLGDMAGFGKGYMKAKELVNKNIMANTKAFISFENFEVIPELKDLYRRNKDDSAKIFHSDHLLIIKTV